MKLQNVVMSIAVLALASGTAQAKAKIDPGLAKFVRTESTSARARITVLMANPKDLPTAPRKYQHTNIVRYLRGVSAKSWELMRSDMDKSGVPHSEISKVKIHWIANSFSAEVSIRGLQVLSELPGVKKIYLDRILKNENPKDRRRLGKPRNSFAEDVKRMTYAYQETKLDQLLNEIPTLSGAGVLIGSIDTGMDGTHPALQGKIPLFFDAKDQKMTSPFEPEGEDHGTHTAGTMVGGDRGANRIGMAPGAKLIGTSALSGYDEMLRGMEFMLDPDKNPNTPDFPRAVNNSWNCGGAPDVELFYNAIGAWEAAGIIPVFSAGNSGPGDETITPPHEHPSVIAVGATDEKGKITDFSSRGPGNFRGTKTQVPTITAPGNNILSSLPKGEYGTMSGTSMATPQVTGAIALLLQLFPKLRPDQVRELLIKSATPMNLDGSLAAVQAWNKAYGFGKMDLYKAAQMAKAITGESFGRGRPLDLFSGIVDSPERLDARRLANREEPRLDEVLSYNDGTDGTWLEADDLF